MANTLTNLIPTLYQALDVVSRELVGFIPAVAKDSEAAQAAVNQSIRVPVTGAETVRDVSPGTTPPDYGDATVGSVEMKITKSRMVPVRFSGEEQKGLKSGKNYEAIMRGRFAQAMRSLVAEIEADLAGEYYMASRAYGSAGTAPFGTANDFSDFAQVRKILSDNGAPLSDLQLVLGSKAAVNLRSKFTNLLSVADSGESNFLRQGTLGQVEGLHLRESSGVVSHVKGAGTGYDVNVATTGEVAGQTTLTLDGGTVNTTGVKAGDIVTFAADTVNKYVVQEGLTEIAGDIKIGAPGLLVDIADANEMTIGANYAANLAFDRNAIQLVTRAPEMPDGGDSADDVTIIVDPVSGLAFQVALYRLYRRVHYEIGIAWGVKAIKPEHITILLG